MSGAALVLLALSLGDLVSGGMTGEPASGRRTVLGLLCATVSALLGVWWIGFSPVHKLVIVGLASAGTAGWLWAKSAAVRGERVGGAWQIGLVLLASVVSVTLALSGMWAGAPVTGLSRWLATLPFPVVESVEEGRFLLFVAVVLFLSGSSNAVVRGILTVAGTEWESSEERLRGGRFIGVLERWMIFGLVVAGEPTAAALIVSAKSLLRFPELSSAARQEPDSKSAVPGVDVVTEYFLLGSLLSWALALAATALFLRPG